MANHGGLRVGAGRKSHAQRLLDSREAASSLASWFHPEYQKSRWQALLGCGDPHIELKAICYLSDRLYGKATSASMEEQPSEGLTLTDEELRSRIIELQAPSG